MMKRRISLWKQRFFHFTQKGKHRRKTPLLLLLVIGLLIATQIPATSDQSATPLGGRGETISSTVSEDGHYCNMIVPVLQHFDFPVQEAGNGQLKVTVLGITTPPLSFDSYLAKLPSDPTLDLSYNPQTQQVCASEAKGKQSIVQWLISIVQNLTNATKQPTKPVAPGPNLDPVEWVTDAITGFWDKQWRQMADFSQHQIIDWANDYGFIWITPAALSYKNSMVQAGANWAVGALDGYIALLLVIGGYQALLNRALGLEERSSVLSAAMRVIFMAIIANTGFFLLLPSMIELANTMGMGIMGTMIRATPGDVSLPLGGIDWVKQPFAWGLFILIYMFISLLLIAVEAVRLAVLDVTIMFSPLWIMALANEYSRAWGRFGALTFFSALLMQPIQVGCISLGSALIANFGNINPNDPSLCQHMRAAAHDACVAHLGHASISGSMNIVVLVLGIATLYVAIKIPGMLFSNALRASVGSVNRDIAQTVRTIMNFMFIQKLLG